MVARRLADESVQPAEFAFNNDNETWAEKRIGLYPAGRQQSAVIPLLMRVQEQEGWISRAAIEKVAELLGMPYIRVLEVATFYTQFQLQPVGTRAHIQVCGTTPCMLRGAEDLRAVCQKKIHPEPHHTNADGTLSWEEVECLGACVNAPMVAIFNDTYEDLTTERFEEIIDAFAAGQGESIKPGPQVDRMTSAPEGGRLTLIEEPTATREKFVPPPPPEETEPAPKQEPTSVAKPKKDVTEESAPAIKEPSRTKVSQAKAEGERLKADAEAKANGKPNNAMREGAAGAESEAGKFDKGKAPGKKTRGVPPAATAATGTQAKARPATPKAGAPQVNPVVEKGGDTPLFTAPEGPADNLKLIAGVGPALEGRLNALGITRWSQIAALSDEDAARVDNALSFKGRVARDNWVGQAKALTAGGIEEYRRVFGRDPR